MLEDFELEQRHLKTVQDINKKWQNENKQYLERVEQMKEKKEENYNNRRNDLIKIYDKKQKEIEAQLFKIKESKEGARKKLLRMMRKKEKLALEKKKLREEKDENNRLRYETQIFSKCNKYIHIYII